jgi:hypothetical protein
LAASLSWRVTLAREYVSDLSFGLGGNLKGEERKDKLAPRSAVGHLVSDFGAFHNFLAFDACDSGSSLLFAHLSFHLVILAQPWQRYSFCLFG